MYKQKMKIKTTLIIGSIVFLLVGCESTKSVHFDGKSATYTHDNSDFAGAMIQARAQCQSVKKGIKHESTACGTQRSCFSTFTCMSE